MTDAARETIWRQHRRNRAGLFPTTDNFAALMALVTADLSESQIKTFVNLISQRGVDLTALMLEQLREFIIALFHAPGWFPVFRNHLAWRVG